MSEHDDVFQQLSRTLDVAPSREFAKGVHARIARRRLIVRSTVSGLAIAASVVVVALIRWPEPAQSIAIQTVTPPVVALSNITPPTIPAAVTRHVPPPQPRRITPGAEPDRLQVVTNQMAVLRAIWAGHRVTAEETEAPAVEVSAPTEPMPVVVEPVRVLPIVIVDRRPPTEGLPIIRRAVVALETK